VSVAADAAELLEIAVHAATAAGRLVRGRPEQVSVASTKTSPVDVVTAMDTAAETLIVEQLLARRPGDGVLGEEGGLRPGSSGLTWVVDPIDGTVNYLYGIPAYAVSIAVVSGQPEPGGWTVLAGCVLNPVTEEVWTATAGGGAYLNGAPLPGPAEVTLDRALVGTGFGYVQARRRGQGRVLASLLPEVRDIRRAGSAALDLCALASGRLDAYYERGLQPWDQAAGVLVAVEAGARVSGPGGLSPSEELVVAAAPRLHASLLLRLAELDACRDED